MKKTCKNCKAEFCKNIPIKDRADDYPCDFWKKEKENAKTNK